MIGWVSIIVFQNAMSVSFLSSGDNCTGCQLTVVIPIFSKANLCVDFSR